MREIFSAELAALGEDLVAMSRLVETAMDSAGQALFEGDLALAETVIADDHTIDAMESEIDERCVMLIAQQQPVARDLRVIVAGLRVSASLERMGDLARHLAQVARLRYPGEALPPEIEPTYREMHKACVMVSRKVTTVLESNDLDLAADIEAEDDVLDRLLASTFAMTVPDPHGLSGQQVVDATLCARYFERFGDHGVAIARRVNFLVTGEFDDHESH
jgi:phosphate transport system protein